MSTYFPSSHDINRKWFVVDASGKTLGRLATEAASTLSGKKNPKYTPFIDMGDHLIVVNAEKVVFSGKKWEQKEYKWYTGYTSLRSETAGARRARRPELIIQEAVRRMLPKNKLAVHMLSKLKVYAGPEHPHQAQQPQPLELKLK